MSETRLRRAGLRTRPAGDENDLALAGLGKAKPTWQAPIPYAVLTAIACSIAIASLVAAPGTSGLLGGALGLLMLAIAGRRCALVHYPRQADLRCFRARLDECRERGFGKHAGKHRGCRVAWTCSGSRVFRSAGSLLVAAPSPWTWPWRRQARRGGRGLARLVAHSGCDRNRGGHWTDRLHSEPACPAPSYMCGCEIAFRPFLAPAIWVCWLLNAICFEF